MHLLSGSIAILALFANVKSDEEKPTPLPILAKVTVTQGEARLFSDEFIQLGCSIPDEPESKWTYYWFRNEVPLGVTNMYTLQKVAIQQGGNYACYGEKETETWPYTQRTLQSAPFSVYVDGGWVLLRVPTEPLLIDQTMTLTCRVRDNPLLVEVVFYKDEVEIKKQNDKNLVIPVLTLRDKGTYSCKATWTHGFDYHSAQSLPIHVPVLDKLNTPTLEVQPSANVRKGTMVVFRCVTQLNVKMENPIIVYTFMKDGTRLGPAATSDTYTIPSADADDPGFYTCKAYVRSLKLERWSEELELKVRLPRRPTT